MQSCWVLLSTSQVGLCCQLQPFLIGLLEECGKTLICITYDMFDLVSTLNEIPSMASSQCYPLLVQGVLLWWMCLMRVGSPAQWMNAGLFDWKVLGTWQLPVWWMGQFDILQRRGGNSLGWGQRSGNFGCKLQGKVQQWNVSHVMFPEMTFYTHNLICSASLNAFCKVLFSKF